MTSGMRRRRSPVSQGFPLEDVKNLLGHSSIVLTSNTYGHVLEQRQRAVARGMDAGASWVNDALSLSRR